MTKTSSPSPFGPVLAAARESRGLTQGQLARKMGRSPQQISRMENGEREPMLSTILLVAAALDMDPGELVRRAAAAMPPPVPVAAGEEAHDA